MVPRVTDIHLEHDAGAHLDVVAQRASEVRGQHDPPLERVLGAAPERDVLGAHRQHAAIAEADPGRRRAPHGTDGRLRGDAAGRDLAAGAREKVVGADEVGDEPADRPFVELLGGRHLEHPAVAYHGDAVRERKRFFLIVRDVHGRDSQVLLQLADLGTHLYPDLRIEVRQRLVQEQDVRVQHEGAGERDALLLAAGELAGITELEARQVDLAEAGRDALGDRGTVELSHLESVGDVRLHRHVRPERIVLEHHADVTRVGPEPVDAPVPEPDLAAVQRMEAGDQPEKRRLAAARGPEQREQLAVTDLEARAVDRGHAPELLTHLAEPDLHRRSRSSMTTPSSGRTDATASSRSTRYPCGTSA